ncbi:VCBS repeat-containing protein [Streptomyces sp. ISL-86]|nr:VCBS repeat-containing protein [Streptomyces sp. ISL-86]
MSFMRSKRSGRIAACTAVALAAGMLLAGPASADTAPKAAAELQRPTANERAGGVLPTGAPTSGAAKQQKQTLQRSADGTAGVATAGAIAKPRFDVNGDGSDDILYRGFSGRSYLKTSGPNDTPDAEYGVEKARSEEDFKDVIPAGDLDGNGQPELLQLSIDGTLTVVEASVTGTSYPKWSDDGWRIYNKLIGAGDLTGDGKPDLLARTYGGDLYLYPGNGQTSTVPFGARIAVGGGWDMFDKILGGTDFDADGTPDLLATTPDGDMFFYHGNGNGTFAGRVKNGYGWTMYNQLLPLTDNDGTVWVLARELSGQTWLYRGKGNGQLGDRVKWGANWQYTSLFAGQGGIPAHGKSEAMARTSGGTLYGYWGQANGNFQDREQIGESGGFPTSFPLILTSSLDRTSAGDLLYIYQGGLYKGDTLIGGGWGSFSAVLGVGDLNGDGYGDLIGRDASNVLWFYPGQGDGIHFSSRVRVGGGWGIYNKLIGAGDVTGDGRADLVARGTDGTLWVYSGTGSTSRPLNDRVKIGTGGWNGFNKLAAVGDITGDGRADIVGVDSSGTAYRYSATGRQGTSTFNGRGVIGGGWNTYKELF